MFKKICLIVLFSVVASCAHKGADKTAESDNATKATPTVTEQLQAMGKMCQETSEARKARDAKKSFYRRLGGKKKIQKLTYDFVSLHFKNEKVAPFFSHSDVKAAFTKGANWLITNTGGPKVYYGPSLQASHGHRNISSEAFLAAGGDVMQAMKSNGYDEVSIQDMMCLLGSHMSEVVTATK